MKKTGSVITCSKSEENYYETTSYYNTQSEVQLTSPESFHQAPPTDKQLLVPRKPVLSFCIEDSWDTTQEETSSLTTGKPKSPKVLADKYVRFPISVIHSKAHHAFSPMLDTLKRCQKKRTVKNENQESMAYTNNNIDNPNLQSSWSTEFNESKANSAANMLTLLMPYYNQDMNNYEHLVQSRLETICGSNFSSEELNLMIMEYLSARLRMNIVEAQSSQASSSFAIQNLQRLSGYSSPPSTSSYEDVEFLR